MDSNDIAPKFKGPNPLKLSINSNFGSSLPQFLYKFEVEDLDTVTSLANKHQKFQFEILQGDLTLFDLNTKNGVLSIQRILDSHELKQLIDFEAVLKFLNISISDGYFKTLVGAFY